MELYLNVRKFLVNIEEDGTVQILEVHRASLETCL